jgi:protein TonB
VKGDAPLVPTLEVIFSQTRTALTPKQADFLAAANQEGGGEHDRAQRPRDNQAGIVPQARRSARCRSSNNRPRRFRRRRPVVSSRNGEETVAQAQARPTPDQPEPDAP